MRLRIRYALLGALFGLTSPLGSLGCRLLSRRSWDILSIIISEWRTARYYYLYMTLGTSIAFSLFGLKLGRHDEDLSNLSLTDGLTGLYNHRYLHEQLAQEIKRADRYHSPLTCLMLDIDDFKKVNDAHGHPFGDQVLTTIARQIRKAIRDTDRVGRYGGEEFLVIMPQTTGEAALPVAERILKAVATYTYSKGKGAVRVTLSIGLATYPEPARGVKTKSALVSAADQALYQAKRAGKNRAVVWQA